MEKSEKAKKRKMFRCRKMKSKKDVSGLGWKRKENIEDN